MDKKKNLAFKRAEAVDRFMGKECWSLRCEKKEKRLIVRKAKREEKVFFLWEKRIGRRWVGKEQPEAPFLLYFPYFFFLLLFNSWCFLDNLWILWPWLWCFFNKIFLVHHHNIFFVLGEIYTILIFFVDAYFGVYVYCVVSCCYVI